MWDCDWFRRFESRYFADDFFTDFEEEMQEEFEDAFMDIKAELMRDYETPEDVGVREFSSFVYGYSMTIEYNEKPRIRKIRNEGVGSGGSKVHKYNRPHITTPERESLAEVNI